MRIRCAERTAVPCVAPITAVSAKAVISNYIKSQNDINHNPGCGDGVVSTDNPDTSAPPGGQTADTTATPRGKIYQPTDHRRKTLSAVTLRPLGSPTRDGPLDALPTSGLMPCHSHERNTQKHNQQYVHGDSWEADRAC